MSGSRATHSQPLSRPVRSDHAHRVRALLHQHPGPDRSTERARSTWRRCRSDPCRPRIHRNQTRPARAGQSTGRLPSVETMAGIRPTPEGQNSEVVDIMDVADRGEHTFALRRKQPERDGRSIDYIVCDVLRIEDASSKRSTPTLGTRAATLLALNTRPLNGQPRTTVHVWRSATFRATTAASGPTPNISAERRVRMKCTPQKNRPDIVGLAPSRVKGKPSSSQTGGSIQR